MAEINYKPIADKLEELIKKKIKDEKLVETGKLLGSISVKFNNGSFDVIAEDYYKYLDAKYNISESVIESNEFTSFVEEHMAKEIEKLIK